ncbi:MAG: DUF1549 domain-containing protein [Planctomycetes bacterium]|nr:DUF1549 domain-containing protein [Planctomycetota bacterium]MCB9885845.1 DUF1549 domain-containing protein [Planctomycetota bacterium]
MNRITPTLVSLSALLGAAGAQQFTSLHMYPPRVQLDSARDQQRLSVTAVTKSGVTFDVTARARWQLDGDAATLQLEPAPRLSANVRGDAVLTATLDDLSARVAVRVEHPEQTPPISFTNEVLPILTRSGCNAGSCHGAAAGKNGFGLSLFAFDPAHDHFALTRQLRGRRIDPAQPELSLILQKGGGLVPHKGGRKLAADGPMRGILREWIGAGAPDDRQSAPALRGIEVMPTNAVLTAGSHLSLQVLARYADGSDRDVTDLTLWSSGNDGAVTVDKGGDAQAQAAGEAALLARFGGLAVTAQVLVLTEDTPFSWPLAPATNLVDRAIHDKLQRARVVPAEVCSDEQFVRRVSLDLTGQLPDPAAAAAFVADTAADKRARWIAALLERPEFAQVQAMAWAEVLRVDSRRMETKGAARFAAWLREQFVAHRPFDQVVREMLTSDGASFASPPANYWLAADQPNLLAEHTAQTLLGVRMQCAQCHNHPFENWTMDDYYGFAAFFGQLARKRGEDGQEWVLWNRGRGDVRNKRDNQIANPRFLGGGAAEIPAGADRRAVLADWLIGDPAFARNVVNRLWSSLLGRGLVEPPDDVRVSNPPSHPELLQQLADLLVENRFDVRPVVTAICNSRTYQLAASREPTPAALFASANVRRLAAEPLLDAIDRVTGVATRLPGVPLGGSATEIASGRTGLRFLDLFGRPEREGSCTCDRRAEPTLGQTLHLINGETITQKIAAPDGRLRRALADKQDPAAMLDELFQLALSRKPSPAEQEAMLGAVHAATDAKAQLAAWQDVYWAVLNSKEFLFQH